MVLMNANNSVCINLALHNVCLLFRYCQIVVQSLAMIQLCGKSVAMLTFATQTTTDKHLDSLQIFVTVYSHRVFLDTVAFLGKRSDLAGTPVFNGITRSESNTCTKQTKVLSHTYIQVIMGSCPKKCIKTIISFKSLYFFCKEIKNQVQLHWDSMQNNKCQK